MCKGISNINWIWLKNINNNKQVNRHTNKKGYSVTVSVQDAFHSG